MAPQTPASFIQKLARDPASSMRGAPPGFGQEVMPHIFSVAGRVGTIGRTYPWFDEATRDSRENAEMMRTEAGIMECLEARQRGTALLKWHVEPAVDNDANKDLAAQMTDVLQRTKDFLELRRNLLEALWYGRYLTSHRIATGRIAGRNRMFIRKWTPRHGDKLVFRYDDGTGQYNDDQIGLRMAGGYRWTTDTRDYTGQRRDKIEANTQFGLVYWLDEYERKRVAVHRHMIEDGDFFDPRDLGRVNGVGIRDRIYWTWYAMQQTLANALNFIERNAHGIEIWKYPMGNAEAKSKTEIAASERSNKAVFVVPVAPGDMADAYGVDVIEPGFAGLEALMTIITDFFAHKIKRYILGQTLTSEAEATGLGSGVADAHMATYGDIVLFDATKLSETITTDILRPLQLWNHPDSEDVELFFKIDTEHEDMASKLEAWQTAWNMGAKLPESDVLSMIGSRMPDEGDSVLENPQMSQAAQAGMQQFGQAEDTPWQAGAKSTFGPFGASAGTDGANAINLQRRETADRYSASAAEVQTAARQAAVPTEAQSEAGNYRLGHVRMHGLSVSIETPKGRRRKPDWPPLGAHYGYIRRTTGKDSDHLDVFIGPHPESEIVFVIDQLTASGRFDEHKAMLGFTTEEAALGAYRGSYGDGWKVGPCTAMTVDQFKRWLDDGDQTKPVAKQVSRYAQQRKLTKTQAAYRPCGAASECCGNCEHLTTHPPDFESHGCDIVEGLIDVDATCKLWEGPAQYARQPSDGVPPAKARKILEDGQVYGKPLTDKQRGMFGAAAARYSVRASGNNGLAMVCIAAPGGLDLDRFARRTLKSSPGQRSLWKEEDHPRDADGQFSEKPESKKKLGRQAWRDRWGEVLAEAKLSDKLDPEDFGRETRPEHIASLLKTTFPHGKGTSQEDRTRDEEQLNQIARKLAESINEKLAAENREHLSKVPPHMLSVEERDQLTAAGISRHDHKAQRERDAQNARDKAEEWGRRKADATQLTLQEYAAVKMRQTFDEKSTLHKHIARFQEIVDAHDQGYASSWDSPEEKGDKLTVDEWDELNEKTKRLRKQYAHAWNRGKRGYTPGPWEALEVAKDRLESAKKSYADGDFSYSSWRDEWYDDIKVATAQGKDLDAHVLDAVWYEDWLPAKYKDQWTTQQNEKEWDNWVTSDQRKSLTEDLKDSFQRAQEPLEKLMSQVDSAIPPEVKQARQRVADAKKEHEAQLKAHQAVVMEVDRKTKEAGAAGGDYLPSQEDADALDGAWKPFAEAAKSLADAEREQRDAEYKHGATWLQSLRPKHDSSDHVKLDISPEVESQLKEHESLDNVRQAVDWLNRFVPPHLATRKPVKVELGKLDENGYYRANAGGDRMTISPKESSWTVIHEYGHNIESDRSSEIGHLSRAFLTQQLESHGERPKHPGGNFEAHEVMAKDGFWNAYSGKFYSHATSEILSMGLQHLFQNPLMFYRESPEHFRYTMALLHDLL